MVTSWMVIQSLSIAQNPQELQVVTTREILLYNVNLKTLYNIYLYITFSFPSLSLLGE